MFDKIHLWSHLALDVCFLEVGVFFGFVFCLFVCFCCTHGMRKFLGQESNLSSSGSCCSDNAVYLTCLATLEFLGGFNQFQFQYLCSYFLFLPGSVLEGCTFVRICSFLLGCLFYWHIVVCSGLLWSFYFCGISWNFSFFVSNFIG